MEILLSLIGTLAIILLATTGLSALFDAFRNSNNHTNQV